MRIILRGTHSDNVKKTEGINKHPVKKLTGEHFTSDV
jgi:hypothetical protein